MVIFSGNPASGSSFVSGCVSSGAFSPPASGSSACPLSVDTSLSSAAGSCSSVWLPPSRSSDAKSASSNPRKSSVIMSLLFSMLKSSYIRLWLGVSRLWLAVNYMFLSLRASDYHPKLYGISSQTAVARLRSPCRFSAYRWLKKLAITSFSPRSRCAARP